MSLFSVSPECDKADPSAHLPGHFPYSSNMEDVLPSRLRCRPLVNSSRGEGLLGYSFSVQMENIESLFVTMGEAYSWGKVIKTSCTKKARYARYGNNAIRHFQKSTRWDFQTLMGWHPLLDISSGCHVKSVWASENMRWKLAKIGCHRFSHTLFYKKSKIWS